MGNAGRAYLRITYEMGGDYKPAPNYTLGSLGADFVYDEDAKAYRITHIINGDSWKNNSPLRNLGLESIIEGDYRGSCHQRWLTDKRSYAEFTSCKPGK
ncbi:MAG: PDZ domain-containing protein [Ignavibacteria bacterium]